MIDTTDTPVVADLYGDAAIVARRDIDRALISRAQHEAEEDAKLVRRIRLAMAAKETSDGCCFYCGRKLDVERDEQGDEIKLHPEPYLECKGPSTNSRLSPGGRIEPVLSALPVPAKKAVVDLKPVRRPFGMDD